jgi:hypothetical protein
MREIQKRLELVSLFDRNPVWFAGGLLLHTHRRKRKARHTTGLFR